MPVEPIKTLPLRAMPLQAVPSCIQSSHACSLASWQATELNSALQVSVNDFIVRATALALADVPRANSQWDTKSGEVVPCQSIDISIAVSTDKGLITPIVKDADKKSLMQISAEVSKVFHFCFCKAPFCLFAYLTFTWKACSALQHCAQLLGRLE